MEKTKKLTKLALFTAIIMMLGLTPLGFFHLPIASLTTVHIPVIVGGLLFSATNSIYLGAIFGLTSFIRCFTTPDATAMIMLGTNTGGFKIYNLFLIVAILFLPRILTGLFANLSNRFLSKFIKKDTIVIAISSFIGSMTNTIFFLGGLYVLAFDQAAAGFGMEGATPSAFLMMLLGIVAFNGVLEATFAVIVCTPVASVLKRFTK